MSNRAWAYITGVFLAAALMSGLALRGPAPSSSEWLAFLALTFLATLTQLFRAEAPNHQFYYATRVFQFAGVLLLPPSLLVLLMVVPHTIEWAKERLTNSQHLRSWYIQPFNIATHILSGLLAQMVYLRLDPNPTSVLGSLSTPVGVLSIISAALTYLAVNHFLVGQALVLAQRISWRESGVLHLENLLIDFVLLLKGYTVALLWEVNPWAISLAVLPLLLIYRALKIPLLKREAQTDNKTGLWNARHFTRLFHTEIERATRFDRPLAIIMADLDLLRDINNTHGHIAGDAVLEGIGRIIRETVREYDIAARFGGEEFAIVLPESGPAEARDIAERLRKAIESASFEAPHGPARIHATMSFGVACFPAEARTAADLLHQADVAVYRAKLNGRNCVVGASDVPHSLSSAERQVLGVERTETAPASSVPDMEYVVAYALQPAAGSQQLAVSSQQAESATNEPLPVLADAIQADRRPGGDPVLPAVKDRPPVMLGVFVGLVIACAIAVTILGPALGWGMLGHPLMGTLPSPPAFALAPFTAIALLIVLAAIAELLQINLYGPDTVSVSVALGFAAALVGGIPAMACVSAAIALVHYYRRRPALYKTAFNWATHLLAGVAPALTLGLLGIELHADNLLVLAVPIALAALVYYVIDTGLVATAIGLSIGTNPLVPWRERFQWLAGHYLVLCVLGLFLSIAYVGQGTMGMLVFAVPVLMMRYSQQQYIERTEDSVRELRRMNDELSHANREVLVASRAIEDLNEELFLTLARIIDARDPYVGEHASKVADYAVAIAVELGMPEERFGPLRQAGFLHDIGKIAISEAVLQKPSKLTPEEYEYIKTHAAIGGELLQLSRSLRHLSPFVRHHHERWDGKGYPDELRGEEIPLEARILAICDSAEAMASDRPYRKGMSLDEMVEEVKRCAGTQFDPAVAAAFVRVVAREREQLVVNSAHEVDLRRGQRPEFRVTKPEVPALARR